MQLTEQEMNELEKLNMEICAAQERVTLFIKQLVVSKGLAAPTLAELKSDSKKQFVEKVKDFFHQYNYALTENH
jgi:hypothetical protein